MVIGFAYLELNYISLITLLLKSKNSVARMDIKEKGKLLKGKKLVLPFMDLKSFLIGPVCVTKFLLWS